MHFNILGPLEVSDGERELPLGGSKQRALLAMLVLHANEVVSNDALVDALWGERPPDGAVKALQVHVSQLRKALSALTLVTRSPGYVLTAADGDIDSDRFEWLVGEAATLLDDGHAAAAGEALDCALALWRGAPLADLAEHPFADEEVRRLEEVRLAALEQRIEVRLALGSDAELVGEIGALVRRHPLRERLRAQLMVAMYRAGRQADALNAYAEARDALLQLGLEPGAELERLQYAVLNHDPALAVAPAGVEAREPDEAPPVPREGIVGRERELAVLDEALEEACAGHGALVLLVGEPGIGKTRLAEEAMARGHER